MTMWMSCNRCKKNVPEQEESGRVKLMAGNKHLWTTDLCPECKTDLFEVLRVFVSPPVRLVETIHEAAMARGSLERNP